MTPATQETTVGWLSQQMQQWREDFRRQFDRIDKRFDDQTEKTNQFYETLRLQRENDQQYHREAYERHQDRFRQLESENNDRKREIDQQSHRVDTLRSEYLREFQEFKRGIDERVNERDKRHSEDLQELRNLIEKSAVAHQEQIKDMQAQLRTQAWKLALIIGALSGGVGAVANLLVK